VQHRSHLVGRQVNIDGTIVARNKSVTITVSLDNSFNFVQQAAGLANIFNKPLSFLGFHKYAPELFQLIHLKRTKTGAII
jgi:hypothetical protein